MTVALLIARRLAVCVRMSRWEGIPPQRHPAAVRVSRAVTVVVEITWIGPSRRAAYTSWMEISVCVGADSEISHGAVDACCAGVALLYGGKRVVGAQLRILLLLPWRATIQVQIFQAAFE